MENQMVQLWNCSRGIKKAFLASPTIEAVIKKGT